MATGGSSWALRAIGGMFAGTTAPVFVANPTFNGSVMILRDELSLNVIPGKSFKNIGFSEMNLHCMDPSRIKFFKVKKVVNHSF